MIVVLMMSSSALGIVVVGERPFQSRWYIHGSRIACPLLCVCVCVFVMCCMLVLQNSVSKKGTEPTSAHLPAIVVACELLE